MEQCSLECNRLPSCNTWSEKVSQFTECAQRAQLTCVQKKKLKEILSLLVSGINGCVLLDVGGSNHGTETADSITVRTHSKVYISHCWSSLFELACRLTGRFQPLFTAWYVLRYRMLF